jgi:septum site-determining protein MinD
MEMAAKHLDHPGIRFLTAPLNRSADKIDREAFTAMLQKAKWEYDYILLDAPAGVDAGFRLVTGGADRFLVVTGAGPGAIRDACRVGELLELAGK